MEFDQSSFNLDTPESWLIVLAYAGFLIYSYYSLVVCLIHIRKSVNSKQSTVSSKQ